jgi:hypothetical protein
MELLSKLVPFRVGRDYVIIVLIATLGIGIVIAFMGFVIVVTDRGVAIVECG